MLLYPWKCRFSGCSGCATQLGLIAKNRPILNFKNSWNWLLILVYACILNVKLIHLTETEMLKVARNHIKQTKVTLFLAVFSHLDPLCAWRLLCWWSCPIKKQTFITHAHAKYGYLMLIMYRQFFKSHEDFFDIQSIHVGGYIQGYEFWYLRLLTI